MTVPTVLGAAVLFGVASDVWCLSAAEDTEAGPRRAAAEGTEAGPRRAAEDTEAGPRRAVAEGTEAGQSADAGDGTELPPLDAVLS
jgi:hypothetical protein